MLCYLYLVTGGSQVCRPHFHNPLHSWLADSKSMVPHAAHQWMSPFSSKSLTHPNPAAPLSVHPATSNASNSFNFPPTPPKDGTPENIGANTEYTPDNKPSHKHESQENIGASFFGSHGGGHTAHPVPTYPTFGGSDYPTGPLGFHAASVFKATSALSRPRTKTRSSAGNYTHSRHPLYRCIYKYIDLTRRTVLTPITHIDNLYY